jgi:hypothetical protein
MISFVTSDGFRLLFDGSTWTDGDLSFDNVKGDMLLWSYGEPWPTDSEGQPLCGTRSDGMTCNDMCFRRNCVQCSDCYPDYADGELAHMAMFESILNASGYTMLEAK